MAPKDMPTSSSPEPMNVIWKRYCRMWLSYGSLWGVEARILLDYHVGPKWNLKYLFIKEEIRRKFNIHRREGNVTAEAETSDVATSQEVLAATRYWKGQSTESYIQRLWPWFLPGDTDFGFLATRTVNKYTSVISSHQNSGNLLQQVQETNTILIQEPWQSSA